MFAQAFTGTSTDVAENYSDPSGVLEPGDLVSINPNKATAVQASSPNDQNLIGIVSTSPGFLMSDISESGSSTDLVNPKPVALLGRVPTKVSTENGPIEPGNPLTSSSTPGVAMKATKSGPIVGKALESYNGEGVGKIMVFVSVGWYVEPLGDGNGQLSDIKNLTDLSVLNLVSSKINTELLMIGNNKLSVASDGSLSIEGNTKISGNLNVLGSITGKDLTVNKINVVTGSATPEGKSNDSTGSATIKSGELELTVETTAITDKSKVFVTATTSTGGQALIVSEKKSGEGFTVNLDRSFGGDITFDWFIIN
jgi:hypothetical protein